MKKMTRLLCLLLALVMCVGILAACGGDDDPEDTTKAPTTSGTGSGDKWDTAKFGGKTIRVYCNNQTQSTLTATASPNYVRFLEGPDTTDEEIDLSNAVDKAVYDRNVKVADKLDITIDWQTDYASTGNDDAMTHLFDLSNGGVKTTPHVVVDMHYVLIRAEVQGRLYDLKKDYGQATKNYFDFTSENGWYMDIMNSTTLNKDRLYIASGDFLLDSLRLSYNTFVNMDLFDELFMVSSAGGIDDLFEIIIDEGSWDYDTYLEMSQVAHDDSGGADRTVWGTVSTNFNYRSFFFSSGVKLFDYDAEGRPSYVTSTADLDALENYVEKARDVLADPSIAKQGITPDYTATKALEIFSANEYNALFMTDQFLAALEGPNFQNMDHKTAVIPYPKYDVDADYRTLVSDNACSGAIYKGFEAADFPMATAFLQLMTEESDTVMNAYFEEGLKYKNNKANHPRQNEVLNIIRDSITEPLEFLFDNYASREAEGTHDNGDKPDNCHTIYDIIQVAVEKGLGTTTEFSSIWNAERGAKAAMLEEVTDVFYR